VLDIKQPPIGMASAVTSHWCLAHYIIDGHHKILAASRSKRPVGLLSILALDRGISSAQEHAKLIAAQNVEPCGAADLSSRLIQSKSNITGRWIRWLTFAFAGQQERQMQAGIEAFVAPDGAPRTRCALDSAARRRPNGGTLPARRGTSRIDREETSTGLPAEAPEERNRPDGSEG